MKEIKAETLAALYPLETRRTIKNYASFIDEHPEWLEFGNSLLDYKRQKVRPTYSSPVRRGSSGGVEVAE
ncbi:hypothetical protein [Desulfovibrio sp. JC022]|uniref:hypothetical protein n=1 Tax=Desulfovibrio sp. JC022 TaxID=2593642 RepID=UPI0013D0121B|nr:hypothetical protein [Desulfovibrio sp. JC022]NDV21778.1 hypothetical protein [Desulfovibrio sp. JC022]